METCWNLKRISFNQTRWQSMPGTCHCSGHPNLHHASMGCMQVPFEFNILSNPHCFLILGEYWAMPAFLHFRLHCCLKLRIIFTPLLPNRFSFFTAAVFRKRPSLSPLRTPPFTLDLGIQKSPLQFSLGPSLCKPWQCSLRQEPRVQCFRRVME